MVNYNRESKDCLIGKRNNYYPSDVYRYIPIGMRNEMLKQMINHPGIDDDTKLMAVESYGGMGIRGFTEDIFKAE